MKRTLNVYLHTDKVGILEQDVHGQLFFTYSDDWLSRSPDLILSQSLPHQHEPFKRNQCRPFFSGILPEENKRDLIAHNLGISAKNDFSFLEKIGGECGGAVSFLPLEAVLSKNEPAYLPLTEKQLVNLLKELSTRPLMAGERGVRLSLAGVQDKIPLYYEQERFYLPLDSSPSTHIIKPAITNYKGQVYNEALSLNLARSLKIPTAKVALKVSEGFEYLIIERYDRRKEADGSITRLHQEDFCQALGIVPENKYQAEGGPSLKQCFDLIRRVSSNPAKDLETLLSGVIFNILIGNNDAHGKNFSLLYESSQTRLAPFYDLICTAFYKDLDPHMAMKFGGEANPLKITLKEIDSFSKEVGLSKTLVLENVKNLSKAIPLILDKQSLSHPLEKEIAAFIKERAERMLTLSLQC